MRIAKFIAHAGYCSRRAAEALVTQGQVCVDSVVVSNLALRVSEQNVIRVGKQVLGKIPEKRLWLYHKPKGLITTHHDPQERQTVFESLPKTMPRVISVGRLDYNTEGLLLLTNSGTLARYFENPANKMMRRYKCRVFGTLREEHMKRIAKRFMINDIWYEGIRTEIISKTGGNTWVLVDLFEGKNREIRLVFEHLGLEVNRLIRVQYDKFLLNDIPKGGIIEVRSGDLDEYVL